MATTPEGRVKKRLDQMLKSTGVWYYSPQAGPYGVSGIPDRVACVAGKFVGIEAKAAGKKPTALQTKCMAAIEAAGGKCFVVYDADSIRVVEGYIRDCLCRKQSAGDAAQAPREGDANNKIGETN